MADELNYPEKTNYLKFASYRKKKLFVTLTNPTGFM